MSDFYGIKVANKSGVLINMSRYEGKYVLVVNTASKCGYTPQFDGLEKLYVDLKDRGVEVVGFPCNQFRQELSSSKDAAQFCKINYGVTFPIMGLTDVKGKNISPLFDYLTSKKSGFLGSKAVKWNFTKFLVDRSGNVIKRYGSNTSPSKIQKDIEKLLNKE